MKKIELYFNRGNRKNSYIIVDDIKFMHECIAEIEIEGHKTEAIIIIDDVDRIYVCQNDQCGDGKYEGKYPEYKYSWASEVISDAEDGYIGAGVELIKVIGQITPPNYEVFTESKNNGKFGFFIDINNKEGKRLFNADFTPYPSCCGAAILDKITRNKYEDVKDIPKEDCVCICKQLLNFNSRSNITAIAKVDSNYGKAIKHLGFKVLTTFKNKNGGNRLELLSLSREDV